MAKEDWKSINVHKDLVAAAERAAEKQHFPNATQYINDAVRDRLKDDGFLNGGEAHAE